MNDLPAILLLVLRLGTAAALYAFLAYALYLIWAEIHQASQITAESGISPITLRFGDKEMENNVRSTSAQLTIGRDPSCECRVTHETVSSRHARLSFRQNQWWAEDLKSKNGTLLNGAALTAPTVLAQGDVLQCGQVRFEVVLEAQRGLED